LITVGALLGGPPPPKAQKDFVTKRTVRPNGQGSQGEGSLKEGPLQGRYLKGGTPVGMAGRPR